MACLDIQTVKFKIFLKLAFLKGFGARPCRASDHLPDGRPGIAARSSTKASAELLLRPSRCHHCHQCHRRCNAIPTQGLQSRHKDATNAQVALACAPLLYHSPHFPLQARSSMLLLLFLHQVNQVQLHYHSPTLLMSLLALCLFFIR